MSTRPSTEFPNAAEPVDISLFPLPLDPFERYMLTDDRADYPMTFVVLHHFDGALDRALLEQAWEMVLRRHPLCRATVTWDQHTPNWVAAERWPTIDFSDTPLDGRAGTIGSPIDLARECGVRAAVRQSADRSCLLVEHHHAAVDGVAALGFAGELLLAYDALWHGQPIELPPLDSRRLLTRCRPEVPPPASTTPWRDRWFALREAFRFWYQAPSPLAPPRSVIESVVGFVPPEHVFLPAEINQQVRSTAGARGATINDMLLAALFLAIDAWNRQQGDTSERHRVRINMPTNLRERGDAVLPAANGMSFTFLTRRRAECRDPKSLLAGIVAETRAIKRWRLGHLFLGALDAATHVPGLLPWMVGRKMCFATAVLSNVGQLARRLSPRLRTVGGLVRVGDRTLLRTGGVPPMRPQTSLALAVIQYGGGTLLWLRADPRLFDGDAATRLASLVVEGLETLVGVPRGAWSSAVVDHRGIACLEADPTQ